MNLIMGLINMQPMISYATYQLGRKSITIDEFVNSLDDGFIVSCTELYHTPGITRSDISSILHNISKIKRVCIDDPSNEITLLEQIFKKKRVL
jgi:hypothetical protein